MHIYIYKADHPRCKFIGLRFLSCIFLSKKKASTEGANIFVWGLVICKKQKTNTPYSRVAFGLASRRSFFLDSLLGEIF